MTKSVDETEFLESFGETAVPDIRQAMFMGMLLYDAHAIWDYLLAPDSFLSAWFIRFGIVTPIFLLVIKLLSTGVAKRYIREIILVASIFGSTSVLYLYEMTDASNPIYRSSSVMMTMLFAMTMLRMLKRDAIIYFSVMTIEFAAILAYNHDTLYTWLGVLFYLGSIATIGFTSTVIFERYARQIFKDSKAIRFEHERADKLLENIFPNVIAEQLKSGSRTIAEFVPDVTILFADLSGFTLAAANMKAEDVVRELNEIYSAFDYVTKKHGCEKIKTIGDSYMAVCGVPDRVRNHVTRIASLAVELQRVGETLQFNGEPLSIRIGIHTGPVVAGVIGSSRFAYDLWGDTVNVASRMQSSAPQRSIQISEDVKHALGNDFPFAFEPRGAVSIKGKGSLDTWLIAYAQVQGITDESAEMLDLNMAS